MKFEIGERVLVDAWDVKGYGTVVSNEVGLHILVDGVNDSMYFQDKEVKKVQLND